MTEVRWDVRRFDTLASTNDWLLSEARAGVPAGTVAVADHQRSGRGRLGRQWEAPPGTSLLVSVLLRPLAPLDALYAVTASVALAAADACAAVAGVSPEVKWPNDLLVDDRKLAGVLAESDPAAPGGRSGSVAVVVGLGCNVDWDGLEGATSLRRCAGRPVDRHALLEAYLGGLGRRAGLLDEPEGRRAAIEELRRRCATLGRTVRVILAGGEPPEQAEQLEQAEHLEQAEPPEQAEQLEQAEHLEQAEQPGPSELVGKAVDVDDSGRLVVEHDGRTTAVAAGDVVHLRGATVPAAEAGPRGGPG